jgi:hypothetical protein
MTRTSLAQRAIAYESGMWASLFRWILRRPVTREPGAQVFGYVRVTRPFLMVFIVLSAVEVPIFDLIISRLVPWGAVRWTVLALGIYGLIWMIGLLAMITLHPHVMTDRGLRVRNTITVDLAIPWGNVAAVHGRYRSLPSGRSVQVDNDDDGPIVNIVVARQTSVDITLRQPTPLALPSGPSGPTTRLRIYADDPDAFVAAARRHITLRQPAVD